MDPFPLLLPGIGLATLLFVEKVLPAKVAKAKAHYDAALAPVAWEQRRLAATDREKAEATLKQWTDMEVILPALVYLMLLLSFLVLLLQQVPTVE